MNFVWAIGASVIVSLISLIGIVSFLFNEKLIGRILLFVISFAAGAMIGAAFIHLLPEAIELAESHRQNPVFAYTIIGFVIFFMLEKYFYWRHCHEGKCDVHAFSYLNLVGDGIHNFIDGLIIGTSFTISVEIGFVTTCAIILHEVPQELADFGVLVYGGFDRAKALAYNFLSALTAVFGTTIGFYLSSRIEYLTMLLLPFAAGGFIYIAACDLIPELHKQADPKKSNLSLLLFIAGIAFMFFMKIWFHHEP